MLTRLVKAISRVLRSGPRVLYRRVVGQDHDELRAGLGNLGRNAEVLRRDVSEALSQHHLSRSLMYQRMAQHDDAMLAAASLGPKLGRQGAPAGIAFVSILPPDESGIANYSYRQLLGTAGTIDVYSPVRSLPQFLRQSAELHRASGGRVVLHPLAAFEANDVLTPYENVVFVIGNSYHNVDVFQLMRQFALRDQRGRAVCYLHDPACLHIARHGMGLDTGALRECLEKAYGLAVDHRGNDEWTLYESATARGMFGPRLIAQAGIRHFIVNSQEAAQIVRDDVGECVADLRISPLFLPVYDPDPWRGVPLQRRSGSVLVGTFGAPGRDKQTSLVVDAIEIQRKRGLDAMLLVVGYGAAAFVRRRFGEDVPDWLIAAEPPSEGELHALMALCDVAIQLRGRNMGESSGVVPALLGLGVPTIVSPIGAFREYGQAVCYFDGTTAEALADTILSARSIPAAAMSAYVARHRPEPFDQAFLACLAPAPEVRPGGALEQIMGVRRDPSPVSEETFMASDVVAVERVTAEARRR